MKSNIVLKSTFTEPVYGAPILLIVAVDAVKAFNRYAKRFEQEKDQPGGFKAQAVHCEHDYALFFNLDEVSHDFISHEIKHTVTNIMVVIGARSPKRVSKATKKALEEPEAYLTGYITKRIYKLLKKRNINVKD